MSHILSQWLNTEVTLTQRVEPDRIDQDFRSGYLYAELLHKHGLIDNLAVYQESPFSIDAAIRNFTLLEPTLRVIGAPISSAAAHEVITGKEGAAARLLYQIKTGLLSSSTQKLEDAVGILSRKQFPITDSNTETKRKDKVVKVELLPKYILDSSTKKRFVEKEHEFFAERLKAKFRRIAPQPPKSSVSHWKTPKATEEPSNAGVSPFSASSRAKSTATPARLGTAASQKSRRPVESAGTRARKEAEANARPEHSTLAEAARLAEEQAELLRVKMEQKRAEQAHRKKVILDEYAREVSQFDQQLSGKTLVKQKHAATDATSDPKSLKRQIKDASMESEKHLRVLQSKLPPVEAVERQSRQYLEKIRAKRLEEEASRKEREQRRRKILLSQQKAQDELEKAQRESILLDKLSKQSKQERRIAEQLMDFKNEKEIMRQNRLLRDQQYQERRQKDFEDAMQREAVLSKQLRQDYQRQVDIVLEQLSELKRSKEEAKHVRNVETCTEIANQLVDFTLNMAHQLEINDRVIPDKLMSHWKVLFTRGFPLTNMATIQKPLKLQPQMEVTEQAVPRVGSPSPTSAAPAESTATAAAPAGAATTPNAETPKKPQTPRKPETPKQKPETPKPNDNIPIIPEVAPVQVEESVTPEVESLDETEFQSYLEGAGFWPFAGADVAAGVSLTNNEHLSKIVDGLFQVMSAPERKPYVSTLSSYPLKVVMLGKRFSGKTTIAQNLADYCSLTLLEVETITAAAINAFEQNEMVTDEKGKSVKSPRSILGGKAQELLVKGAEVSEEITAALVAEAVHSLNAKIATEGFTGKGWILLDYPKNKSQAAALEKELSGYEEPKPVKLGNLKRNQNSGKENQRSLIARPTSQDQAGAQVTESVIDAIFVLDVNNEMAVRRATGRRVDPVTGRVFHVEFDPPPSDEPGLIERLAAVESNNHNDNQLQFHLSSYENYQTEVKEWFQKFNNLHFVDANPEINDVLANVEGILKPIVDRKPKDPPPSSEMSAASAQPDASNAAAETPTIPEEEGKAHADAGRPKTASSTANIQSAASAKTNAAERTGATNSKPGTANISIRPENLARVKLAVGRAGITKELATILYNKWVTLESTYTDGLKFIFRSLRREREEAVRYFYETKLGFKEFLVRPDKKQTLVDAFQKEYNAVDEDFRSDPEAKAEFHQRAEDLREKLWTISDERKEEAEMERVAVIENRWVEDHLNIVANLYASAVQLEVDRYLGTRKILLDFTKDTNEVAIEEIQAPLVKIPMADLTTVEPLFNDILRIKHEPPATLIPANVTRKNIAAAAATAQKSRQQGAQKKANAQQDKQDAASDGVAATNSAEPRAETDFFMTTLNNSVNAALALIAELDFNEAPKDGKEKGDKKKATQELPSEVKDIHPESVQETIKCARQENAIQKARLTRLQNAGLEHIRELRTKAYQVYMQLDEWIGGKFQSEMEAIRDLTNVIKEAVELEQKLPHELVLEGDHFLINMDVLTFEPELEPRPLSPLEPKALHQYTVHQLLNLGLQFSEVNPSGLMTIKEFKDILHRMIVQTNGSEALPEGMQSMDLGQLQMLAMSMDPYQTGFLQWRQYLLQNANILPVTMEEVRRLKQFFHEKDSNKSGSVDYATYSSITYWYEDAQQPQEPHGTTSRKFNRPKKLKDALFFLFANKPAAGAVKTTAGKWLKDHETVSPEGHLFRYHEFLLAICDDGSAQAGLEKAFEALGDANARVGLKELARIYRMQGSDHDPFPLKEVEALLQGLSEGEPMVDFAEWNTLVEEKTVPYLDCQFFRIVE